MRFRRLAALTACFPILISLPVPAHAAGQWCTGAVWSSWIDSGGSVLISSSWRTDHTQICSLSSAWKGIPVDVCVGWVAKLDAAATMNKSVTIFYADAPACNALPTYSSTPSPVYVMVLNS